MGHFKKKLGNEPDYMVRLTSLVYDNDKNTTKRTRLRDRNTLQINTQDREIHELNYMIVHHNR